MGNECEESSNVLIGSVLSTRIAGLVLATGCEEWRDERVVEENFCDSGMRARKEESDEFLGPTVAAVELLFFLTSAGPAYAFMMLAGPVAGVAGENCNDPHCAPTTEASGTAFPPCCDAMDADAASFSGV